MQLQQIMVLVVVAILLYLLDLYVWSGVKTALRQRSGKVPTWAAVIYWGISAIALGAFIFLDLTFTMRIAALADLMRLSSAIVTTLVLTKLFLVVFLLFEDVVRFGRGIIKKLSKNDKPQESSFLPERRKFLARGALIAATLPFGSLIYAVTSGKYQYWVRRLNLTFPDLPPAFDGFSFVQLSDIHSGSFDSRDGVLRGVEMANELEADIILFTGDMVNSFAEELEPWMDHFDRLSAPLGVLATSGNHDYAKYAQWPSEKARLGDVQKLRNLQRDLGWELLLNQNKILIRGNDQLAIIGVENWGLPPFPQEGDLDRALEGTRDSDFKILMSHDPTHWDEVVRPHPVHIPLTLSGHTHGMQLGVEIGDWRYSPIKYRYPRWADLYEENGQYLYVNRGFGFIGFPGRFGIWPEVTHITLHRA